MTNQEINRYIHRHIMQKCLSKNENCDCVPERYTDDSSPRSLLNAVVAKVRAVGDETLGELYAQLEMQQPQGKYVLEATAEQIARACVSAFKDSK